MQAPTKNTSVVVGIDVGGIKKGFHAVALKGGSFLDMLKSPEPNELLRFCRDYGALAVGIDAPCRFRAGDNRRSAERELSQNRISCFTTPTLKMADRPFYGWMHNGAALYHAIESGYSLYDGRDPATTPAVFETYPHAVERAFCDSASAKQKGTFRRKLLESCAINTSALTNIDFVDAGLCALTAHHLLTGTFRIFGDPHEEPFDGLIVVPRLEWPASSPNSSDYLV